MCSSTQMAWICHVKVVFILAVSGPMPATKTLCLRKIVNSEKPTRPLGKNSSLVITLWKHQMKFFAC